eukprot:364496-Chlamydomonas_euryale.AAC.40
MCVNVRGTIVTRGTGRRWRAAISSSRGAKLHGLQSCAALLNVRPMFCLRPAVYRCAEQDVPVVFALTRKRLGQIYGCRKRVSAVALLDFEGVEGMHTNMSKMMTEGRTEYARIKEETGEDPVVLLEELQDEEMVTEEESRGSGCEGQAVSSLHTADLHSADTAAGTSGDAAAEGAEARAADTDGTDSSRSSFSA